MARLARKEMLDPSEVQVVHAISRCVRRAYLCGEDPVSGEWRGFSAPLPADLRVLLDRLEAGG